MSDLLSLKTHERNSVLVGPANWWTVPTSITLVSGATLFDRQERWSSHSSVFGLAVCGPFGLYQHILHLHNTHAGRSEGLSDGGRVFFSECTAVDVCLRMFLVLTVWLWECATEKACSCVRSWFNACAETSETCGWSSSVFLLFNLSLCLFFYLSWPGHVQIPTIQQFWRVDCINLNNGSLFPFLSHSQSRRWLQAYAYHGDSRPPRGRW